MVLFSIGISGRILGSFRCANSIKLSARDFQIFTNMLACNQLQNSDNYRKYYDYVGMLLSFDNSIMT